MVRKRLGHRVEQPPLTLLVLKTKALLCKSGQLGVLHREYRKSDTIFNVCCRSSRLVCFCASLILCNAWWRFLQRFVSKYIVYIAKRGLPQTSFSADQVSAEFHSSASQRTIVFACLRASGSQAIFCVLVVLRSAYPFSFFSLDICFADAELFQP